MPSGKKVFLGTDNTAGICSRLKTGFEQIGVTADFYSFGTHIFGYKPDIILKYSNNIFIRKIQKFTLLIKLLWKYDYFIFLSRNSFLVKYKDVRLLKKLGKKTSIYFTGCDVRLPEKVAQFKWNTCLDCTQDYKDTVGCVIESKKTDISLIERSFDYIFCHDADAGSLNRDYISNYFPINLEKFPAGNHSNYEIHEPIRILHAPTNEKYKGSVFVYEAIEKLKKKYNIEFIKITGVTIDELYNTIQDSDLIIDSVIGGSYNLLSLEAMAMYKPVVNFVRTNIWEKIKLDCPIYRVDPDTLYDVLEKILGNPGELAVRSKQSREFVEKYHDAKKIAAQYMEIFERRN